MAVRWLAGLRRSHVESGALARWIEARDLSGVIWEPGSWVAIDAAPEIASLAEAGARADSTLLWDLAVDDIRRACDELQEKFMGEDPASGWVGVWMDPDNLVDPPRAATAARTIQNEIGRPNLAVAFAWSGARAGSLSAIVAAGVPVVVTGASNAVDQVRTSRTKGMDKMLKTSDEDADVYDIPVFIVGTTASDGPVHGIEVVAESESDAVNLPTVQEAERSARALAVERLEHQLKAGEADDYEPDQFAVDIARECIYLDEDEILERIWHRDHTVWRDEPTEIADRLGWLDVARSMRERAGELSDYGRVVRSQGVLRIVLLGMGGSSLAPEMFTSVMPGGVPLEVVDTTDPVHISAVVERLDMSRTFFVVASKSGTTAETRSQFELFWSLSPRSDRFAVITDPGSELIALAESRGIKVFINPADIGGRYSALSLYGLLPAALSGIDPLSLLDPALHQMQANAASQPAVRAPAVRLGVAIAEGAAGDTFGGRDKLTLVLPPAIASFGSWVEQLIAESLGKDGKGVLPVDGETLGLPEVYGDDRLFIAYAVGDEPFHSGLDAIQEAGHPIIRIRIGSPRDIGAEVFRWELATAVVGYILDIHPFDQPDVEAAKNRAREALSDAEAGPPEAGSVDDLLSTVEPDDYIAIQAFITPDDASTERLRAVRTALRDRFHVAVTVGFGPRFLHSTGQFHKGGPDSGVCIQVTQAHASDLDVPGRDYTFGRLFQAQADGDLAALRDAGRRCARIGLSELEALASSQPSATIEGD